MRKVGHSVADNRQNSAVSTGSRQKVLGRYGFISDLNKITFYMITHGITSFKMGPHLADLDKKVGAKGP